MQQITKQFHRSMYISLGLACACLGYAEYEFLPEISVLAAVVGVLLVVAYRVEGRWALSIRAANVLGGVIALLAGAWLTYQFMRPEGGLIDQLPAPTWMLPYLGPLLMVLVPAKLFRPKHNGDVWSLQGIGLIAVALGSALTGDPVFGVLMLAYLVAGAWGLLAFYQYRQAEHFAANRRPAAPALWQAGKWVLASTALALGLFLCTPRMSEARWELTTTSGRLVTGTDENRPSIDLNRFGTLTSNREKAFDVIAFTRDDEIDPPPKTDLDPGQRWRQWDFNFYERGQWQNRDLGYSAGRRLGGNQRALQLQLPSIDPAREFYLEFHLPPSRPGARPAMTFADPLAVKRPGAAGERTSTIMHRKFGGRRFSWAPGLSNEQPTPGAPSHAVYDQVYLPPAEPGVTPVTFQVDEPYLEQFRGCVSVPRLRTWAGDLLKRFVREGRLPAAAVGDVTSPDRVRPEYYEVVSRLFEAHLAHSGQFVYSLTTTRKDNDLDPVEDFVLNTHTGQCTRFASALALMLRAVGVPTKAVLGYRGYETTGNGVYEVLQCHAHSWVEAFILRPGAKPTDPPEWRLLTLDPTPSGDDAGTKFDWAQWWESARQNAASLFKNFIIDYDADQQQRTRYAMSQTGWWWTARWTWQLILGDQENDWARALMFASGVTAIVLGVRFLIRRWRARRALRADPAPAFYHRLLAALGRWLGLTPRRGQTPGEFAAAAGGRLRAAAATRDVADVPAETAALYYRVRFGNRPLAPAELQNLIAGLKRLESATARAAGR
jgi:hypothetical protein